MTRELTSLVVATDFSRYSEYAVKRATLLAKDRHAKLSVVHCVQTNLLTDIREVLKSGVNDVQRKILTRYTIKINRLTKRIVGDAVIDVHTQLLEGEPDESITAHTVDLAADLLIIGAHGKGFIQRWLVGSVTSRLARKSNCPVLVVRTKPKLEYQCVLIGIDFSSASRQLIHLARGLAPGAHLILAHACDIALMHTLLDSGATAADIEDYRTLLLDRSREKLTSLARETGLRSDQYTVVTAQGSGAGPLLAFEKTHQPDLIVMGKHGRRVTQELLLGSVTQTVLSRATSDILVAFDDGAKDAISTK
jgi:nucleotide-binding universal stress UspA family protein